MAKYFGTNGVRGLFDTLGPELSMKLAKAIGTYFNCGKIIVSRDGRLTGECIKHAVISGLQSVGCQVVDLDYSSAPTSEFMIKKLKADGLIIITASHNPPEWNALKVVDGKGISISHERGEEIEKLMDKTKSAEWDKVKMIVRYENAVVDHIKSMISFVDSKKIKSKKPKLVLDCGNGMAALIAPKLFGELGCVVKLINENVDGHFPGRPSEPTETNVRMLIETVRSSRADAGIAWDGDGDRVIFVDEKANYVIGDKVFALSVIWKLAQKKGDIITTVSTSRAAQDIAHDKGHSTRYTKIGAPYLSEDMAKGLGVIAGEEVGGVIWPELSLAKDGFLTAAKMVEAICDKPLSKWIEQIPKYYNVKTKLEAKSDKEKNQIVDRVKSEMKKRKLKTIDIDGIRADLDDSWVICRPSGTENYVRIFAEAKSEENAKALLVEWKRIAEGK